MELIKKSPAKIDRGKSLTTERGGLSSGGDEIMRHLRGGAVAFPEYRRP